MTFTGEVKGTRFVLMMIDRGKGLHTAEWKYD